MRMAVALSGGIDSAVAALLMKRAGYQLEGVFMQNWDARIEEDQRYCTVEADYHDACKVASILQIPLRRVNFVREYWNDVFEKTIREYQVGKTPNPDILCNREIKLGRLMRWSEDNGFDRLATGHYARIFKYSNRFYLGQAVSIDKDQSYFLADVNPSVFSRLELPIGGMSSKQAVRKIASDNNLHFLLEKAESMGICFVGKRRKFHDFLSSFSPPTLLDVIEEDTGRVLGNFDGFVTIGQTIKIGGLSSKLFCVSTRREVQGRSYIYASFNACHPFLRPKSIVIRSKWEPPASCEQLFCAIRSNDKEGLPVRRIAPISENTYVIESLQSFSAPAPGQFAVLYKYLPELNTKIIIGSGEILEHPLEMVKENTNVT